jgi:methionyl-tRNA synthetase
MIANSEKAKGRYLLIPVPPTPNGRLHLGHMAGPYLRMDMLRRALEQRGNDVELWTGTDSHDSFVLYRAFLSKSTPADVCRKFHPLIAADMQALNIKVDGFVDTLSGEGRRLQEEHAVSAVDELKAMGLAKTRQEEILFDEQHGFPVVGTWLAGQCPCCGSSCVGYFCEGCFTHNQPGELAVRSSRMPGAALGVRSIDTVFLDIPEPHRFIERLAEMRVIQPAIDVVKDMLFGSTLRNFRLTVPIEWGLSYGVDGFGQSRAIFEVLWELYTYSEMQVQRHPERVPAWKAESDTKVVVACGVDNTVALLMGCVGVYGQLPGAKPPEHIHINYFVKLEGSKFSTNRNHAIWAGDLAETCRDGIDGLRLYLANISPESESTNFEVERFVTYYNEFYIAQIVASVNVAFASLDSPLRDDPETYDEMSKAEAAMGELLSPERVEVGAAVKIFEAWITAFSRHNGSASERYWWLVGVAILGYPFAPSLASFIWEGLGQTGYPEKSELTGQTRKRPAGYSALIPRRINVNAVRSLVGRQL